MEADDSLWRPLKGKAKRTKDASYICLINMFVYVSKCGLRE